MERGRPPDASAARAGFGGASLAPSHGCRRAGKARNRLKIAGPAFFLIGAPFRTRRGRCSEPRRLKELT